MSQRNSIEVTTSTWNRDTHGLFDYDGKDLYKKSFKIRESCSFYRLKEEVYIKEQENIIDSIPLIKIDQRALEYQISLIQNDPSTKMWLIVKDIKSNNLRGYKLNEGDWVKLGRVKLRVQRICLSPTNSVSSALPKFFENNEADIPLDKKDFVIETNTENLPCRICLSESSTSIDPLISPCKCSGTMRNIHLNCLKEWLKSKVSPRISDKGMSFYLKDLVCELCKSSLPAYITNESNKINLLNITTPTKSYIILEEYKPDRNQKQGLHFISLDENQNAIIGRGHDCDIKIMDISVSRKHSKIKFIDNAFYIDDNHSKFGTLAKLKKSFMVRNSYDVSIQVGRTIFRVVYRQPWNCRSLCSCFSNNKVFNANFSYLTQPEDRDSDSDIESYFVGSNQNIHMEDVN